MRLIPVIDLQAGLVVRAIKGEREKYQPLQSILCDSPEPRAVARSFHNKLGLKEIYVADLDAIRGRGNNNGIISSMVEEEGMEILLDAGAGDAQAVQSLLELGIKKVIIGAETLSSLENLNILRASIPANRLIFSLDMQAGQMLSRCSDLAKMRPIKALEMLQLAGWRTVILLDLARVGTGSGIDFTLASEARRLFPELELIVGGGISQVSELDRLQDLGVAGVLLASALHTGTITQQQVKQIHHAAG
jgi:phosphoribosylformimino-5-aminoimidazole carboxamide ribotide isomerase